MDKLRDSNYSMEVIREADQLFVERIGENPAVTPDTN